MRDISSRFIFLFFLFFFFVLSTSVLHRVSTKCSLSSITREANGHVAMFQESHGGNRKKSQNKEQRQVSCDLEGIEMWEKENSTDKNFH